MGEGGEVSQIYDNPRNIDVVSKPSLKCYNVAGNLL